MYCKNCGIPLSQGEKLCSSCAALAAKEQEDAQEQVKTGDGKPKYCRKCVTQIEEGDKFCYYCGNSLDKTQGVEERAKHCSICGTLIREGEKACSYCGQAVPADKNKASVQNVIVQEKPSEQIPKYCKSCGKPMEENAMFCPFCGTQKTAASADAPNIKPPMLSNSEPITLLVLSFCCISSIITLVLSILALVATSQANQYYLMGKYTEAQMQKQSVETYMKIGWVFFGIGVVLTILYAVFVVLMGGRSFIIR